MIITTQGKGQGGMANNKRIKDRILCRLAILYGAERASDIFDMVKRSIRRRKHSFPERPVPVWSEKDTLLITYGDSLQDKKKPLQVLVEFLRNDCEKVFSFVHILPFFPYTSDDGFSVQDFRKVRSDLGTWRDVKSIASCCNLVFDAVVNHVSASSKYMERFCAGDPMYKDFFIELDPSTDTSMVTRPRTLPLLHEYKTSEGGRWLWTTFSADQLDLNFANPAVLVEMVDVLLLYAAKGASMIRLDAIPFLWKQLGTTCSHLPQVHVIVKCLRDIFDMAAPHVRFLTETNVPHQENIAYFGSDGDEAQMIYNFTLAPLVLHAIHTGNVCALNTWARNVRKISDRATYLNVTATHDGIGLRPAEGILSEKEKQALVDRVVAHGGFVSWKKNPDGSESPYELNITFFDALNDPNASESDDIRINRLLLSQAISVAFIGVPGIYIHSLLGSRNYLEGVRKTGASRSINREKLVLNTLRNELSDPTNRRCRIFRGIKHMLNVRAQHTAFSPLATQEVIDFGKEVFALLRHNPYTGETILALNNVTPANISITIDNLPDAWNDVLNEEQGAGCNVEVSPYGVRWIMLGSKQVSGCIA